MVPAAPAPQVAGPGQFASPDRPHQCSIHQPELLADHASATYIGYRDGFFGPFPQEPLGFPALCIARTISSRFFDHLANLAGISCVAVGVDSLPVRFSSEIPGLLP